MNVALWTEIRGLKEIEKLSERKIALRLRCSRHSVARALRLEQPRKADFYRALVAALNFFGGSPRKAKPTSVTKR